MGLLFAVCCALVNWVALLGSMTSAVGMLQAAKGRVACVLLLLACTVPNQPAYPSCENVCSRLLPYSQRLRGTTHKFGSAPILPASPPRGTWIHTRLHVLICTPIPFAGRRATT